MIRKNSRAKGAGDIRRSGICSKDRSRNETTTMPDEMISDLKAAFAIYDTEETGCILMQHVRNVLWNFGMWRISKKEMEHELMKQGIDTRKPYLEWGEILNIISTNWKNNGR